MRTLSQIVQELVPDYLAARRREVPQMAELLTTSDFERLRILSHSLKGSGGSFGFPELSRLGGELERHAQASDAVSFSGELARLANFLAKLDVASKGAGVEETRQASGSEHLGK